MYGIVLTAILTAGGAPVGDTRDAVEDLKRAVEELKKGQTEQRVEELNLLIDGLRQRVVDEKLDEIRRDITDLKREERHLVVPLHHHYPWVHRGPAWPRRAVIHLRLPAGATFFINDKEFALPSPIPTLITPALEPGRDYYYDFKVTVTQDGKTVTRVKRVTVRDGAVVRLAYEEMEAR
jgi:uncharacterized protein (TIGR03000 family)